MLTKKEAAESLGVSERAIERYTKAGRLTPTYQQNKSGGTLALFAERDLDRLKDALLNKVLERLMARQGIGDGTFTRGFIRVERLPRFRLRVDDLKLNLCGRRFQFEGLGARNTGPFVVCRQLIPKLAEFVFVGLLAASSKIID